MRKHNFRRIDDFRGRSLEYFTTHADLVARQAAAKRAERAPGTAAAGTKTTAAGAVADGVVRKDADWSGEKFVEQTDKLVANK
jgi:hypothetical protein